jgi:hypothetical protein
MGNNGFSADPLYNFATISGVTHKGAVVIIVDFIGVIAGFILGFIASYLAQWPTPPKTLWYRYRSRKLRERKCYSLPKGKIYLIPSSSSESLSLYVSQNAMACVQAVTAMLGGFGYKEGPDFEVMFQYADQDNVPEEVRTENLVLICGPKRNRLVESVLRDFPNLLSSIQFETSPEPALIYKGTRYIYEEKRDWALMAIKRNPYNPRKTIILLFGLRSIGTKGAGSFYAHNGLAQARAEVAERLETLSGEIEVLLCIDHTDDYRTITTVKPMIS